MGAFVVTHNAYCLQSNASLDHSSSVVSASWPTHTAFST